MKGFCHELNMNLAGIKKSVFMIFLNNSNNNNKGNIRIKTQKTYGSRLHLTKINAVVRWSPSVSCTIRLYHDSRRLAVVIFLYFCLVFVTSIIRTKLLINWIAYFGKKGWWKPTSKCRSNTVRFKILPCIIMAKPYQLLEH